MELDLKQRHPDNYHMQGCRDGRMQGPPPPIRRDHPKQVDDVGLRDKRLRLIAVLPSLSFFWGGAGAMKDGYRNKTYSTH